LAPIRRTPRNFPARRPNPLRDLMLEKQRAAELTRERLRASQLSSDLPSIIENQVGEQMQKLEDKLITEFRELGKRAVEQSTAALSDQLNGRIETLEKVSNMQSKTLLTLRDSSRLANQKVSQAVDSIESSLAAAVPGFKLEPAREPAVPFIHPQFQPEAPKKQLVKANTQEVTETEAGVRGRIGFCPSCTSTNIRRATRAGLFEEFLRLFFIAPFRCRACRHKFYRF